MIERNNLIKPTDMVRVRVVRDSLSLRNVNTCNKTATIKRISGHRHITLSTGEIVQETPHIKRGDCMYSLLESNIRLQDLIKENTLNAKHTILLTLTYEQKTLNIPHIINDFKVFVKWLRKKYTQFGEMEYINTLELCEDKKGYHIHAILFFNKSTLTVMLPYEELIKGWKRGYLSVGHPKANKDIYFYLTPHLSNEINEDNSHLHNKALLQMELPAGTNLYRYSRGLKKPKIYTDTYENVQKYLKQNEYEFVNEQTYKNPMQAFNGNNLYYHRENYKKAEKVDEKPQKRAPI